MMENTRIFIRILYQFLEFIEGRFPDLKSEVYLTRTAIGITEYANPRMVVYKFMTSVGPYSKQIEECREEFFLNFDNLLNETPKDDNNLMFAMRLKSVWSDPSTTDLDKAKIWSFFKKLLKVGKKVESV